MRGFKENILIDHSPNRAFEGQWNQVMEQNNNANEPNMADQLAYAT